MANLRCFQRILAVSSRIASLLHSVISVSTACDKAEFLDAMALKADAAARHGDYQSTYKIVRLLRGYVPKPMKSVRMKDGSLSTNAEQCQLRWQEHFCELFNGRIVQDLTDLATPPGTSCSEGGFIPSISAVENTIQKLGDRKALGLDGLPAELLKAGGSPLAIKTHEIF
eukprot:11305703-Karenia_brevis.AAC.1